MPPQRGEPPIPLSPHSLDPVHGVRKGLRRQLVAGLPPLTSDGDEPCDVEACQVFGHRLPRDGQLAGELGCSRASTSGQELDDGAPPLVGQG